MKRRFICVFSFLLAFVSIERGSTSVGIIQASSGISLSLKSSGLKTDMNFGKMPLYFIANAGQLDEKVAYYVQGKDKSLYFTSEGVTIVLSGSTKGKDRPEARVLPGPISGERERAKIEAAPDARWVVKLDFVDANPAARPTGVEETGAVISYFKGKPEEWKKGLPTFSKIIYKDLWPGIDLVYGGTVNRLKYEFIVHPGGDPTRIRLAYRGADAVEVTGEGRLAVTTPAGGFEDDVPVAWQEVKGKKADVPVAYDLVDYMEARHPGGPQETEKSGSQSARHEYGFKVDDYDRSRPLILDPAVLVYCGFIGGANGDWASGIAVDGSRNAYVVGTTGSTEASFPVVVGPDLTESGSDAFVAKVNASGTGLVYCGYIGGSSWERGFRIAVDNIGNAYITGDTASTEATFPVVLGPDLTFNDGIEDAFVAKVNASGTSLVYCGYIGGGGDDRGLSIAVDGSGNAYVTGYTDSPEWLNAFFPVVVGPDLTFNGGFDAFVAKVNAKGTALDYCGYIGGSGNDEGYGIDVDSSGNAYVAGETTSAEDTFPVVVGPDLMHNGGLSDVFVAKVNATGTAFIYCGYIGGSGYDRGYGIDVDSSGNAYVAGETRSAEDTFPVVVGPDLTYNNPGLDRADAFAAKINPTGTALVYCGYIGGVDHETALGVAVDGFGNAYIAGQTWSTEATFPVVSGPDLTYNDWGITPVPGDAFVAKVNASGTALAYCGYIGARSEDEARGIAVDGFGDAYVAGHTTGYGSWLPVVTGPDLTYNGGDYDAFVAKISEVPVLVTAPNGGEIWVAGSAHNITWTSTGAIANVKIEYSTNNGTSWTTVIASTSNTGSYPWTIPNTPSTTCLVRMSDASNATVSDLSDAVFTIIGIPTIGLSKTTLSFGAVAGGVSTKSQSVIVSNTGCGTLNWIAFSNHYRLAVTPTSGTGTKVIQVSVNPAGLAAGSYTWTTTVSDPNATNSPQTITVTLVVLAAGTNAVPFGSFDTPVDGTTGITGAIPVTGWALDDIEVTKVEILRDNVLGETPGQWAIGEAIFVEGARPDIETALPGYPMNNKAGWGYMMLTNMLPGQGNGTFKLYAYATDKEGNRVLLGTKTITCSNATAVKPFGTLDSPTQGGEASGSAYANWGWVLTPLNKTVPKNGSTILVYVDGAYVGNLATPPNFYNAYRADVSGAFPGLNNTGGPGTGEGGPVGLFYLDTTKYPNGVHTIAWVATDDGGAAEGIGSRYFNIVNTGTAASISAGANEKASHREERNDAAIPTKKSLLDLPVSFFSLPVKRGFSLTAPAESVVPDNFGIVRIEMREVERLEISFDPYNPPTPPFRKGGGEATYAGKEGEEAKYVGYMIVGDELRGLPIGSTLDTKKGTFSWMPGPGFLGTYELVFVKQDVFGIARRIPIKVTIRPKFENHRE